MSGVDNRVVAMKFDNEDFEKRLGATLKSLEKLSENLKLDGASAGLDAVSKAANHFDPSGMVNAIENIGKHFTAMGVAGITIISNLTTSALEFAKHVGEDILGPIMTGGKDRAKNIEQAKFMFRGLGIDVDKGMASALDAVRGTSYGLDAAAKAAAQFGAAGIKVGKDMTGALRAIAGSAAMTGSSFEEMSGIFTGSAGSGKVTNQDLDQFATRGLNAAAAVAKQMHITEAAVHKMATDGTLDFKTFAMNMDKAFGAHATKANETYSGSLANMHAALSRIGAAFFGPRLEQQRDLFNALTPVIDNVAKALQPLIDTVSKLGRVSTDKFVKMLKGLKFDTLSKDIKLFADIFKNAVTIIQDVLGAIHTGFAKIFRGDGFSADILRIATAIDKFVAAMVPAPETISKIARIFAGLFAIFDIAWEVIKGVVRVLADLLGVFSGVGTGALGVGANLGDMLVKFDTMLVKSGAIYRFFDTLGDRIKAAVAWVKDTSVFKFFDTFTIKLGPPIVMLHEVADAVERFFHSASNSAPVENAAERITTRFEGLKKLVEVLGTVFGGVVKVLGAIAGVLGAWFADLGNKIAAAIKPSDFDAAVDAVNVGLLTGIILLVKKFINIEDNFDITHGLFTQIKDSLGGLKDTLKAMQTELKAKAIEEIAIAVGILTASMVVLSLIDSKKLTTALAALAAGFAELMVTMKVMDQIGSDVSGAARLVLLAGAMNLMATSAVILSGAIAILGNLGTDTLAKGMTALSVALGLMVGSIKLLEGDTAGVLAASVAMIAISTAMTIMAGAVALFGQMNWETLAKGLIGVGAALGIITGLMLVMPVTSTLAAGLAMIPLATGLVILAGAVALFGNMDLGTMVQGLIGLAAGLVIIAGAMNLMPITLPITAAGLMLVALALDAMVPSVKMMGSMDLGTMVKGLVGLAAMLGILVVALIAMDGAVAGAVALVITAHALDILAGVLKTLGSLSWGEIVKGLVALAAVLVVLGLAAFVLEPLIPAMLGLGIAMTILGVGFVLFGAGAYMVGKALTVLAVAGRAGVDALIGALEDLLKALPAVLAIFIASLFKSVGDLADAGQLMIKLIGVLLIQVLETVIKLAPVIAEALVAIITAALVLIRAKFPDIMQTAYELLMVILNTFDKHEVEVINKAVEVVAKFAYGMASQTQKLVDAAITLLVSFLVAISNRANDVAATGLYVLLSFIAAMINNLYRVIDFAVSVVITLAQTIANETGRLVRAAADLLINFAQSLANNIYRVAAKGVDIVLAFLNAIGDQAIRLANGAADALTHFLNGLADAIRNKAPEIRQAGLNVAGAIIDGITGGLGDRAREVADKAKDVAKGAIDGVRSFLHISSPSRKFYEIGAFMGEGLARGLDEDTSAENSAVAHAERIVQAFSETLSKIPNSLEGLDASPVISPVLDLSRVKDQAAGLGDLMPTPSIKPELSYAQARTIASTAEIATPNQPPPATSIEQNFTQNNYSPEALSTDDIYKRTRSQFALAKEELDIP